MLFPSLLVGLITFEQKVPRFCIRMNHRIPFSLDRKMTAPLSVQMAEVLRAAITSGFYRDGEVLPTIHEFARVGRDLSL